MQTHSLDRKVIEQVVPRRAVGFYRLGTDENDEFRQEYFGRSDTDLRRRLNQHVTATEHTHFQVQPTRTILDAFKLECGEWHLPTTDTDNCIHPASPKGIDYECPYCLLKESLRSEPITREATP